MILSTSNQMGIYPTFAVCQTFIKIRDVDISTTKVVKAVLAKDGE